MLVENKEQRKPRESRRAALSFELSEVLHMLDALEDRMQQPANENSPKTA
jgi:hypothetical protein